MSTVTVSGGSSYTVSSGGSDTNDVVLNGGTMFVASGGTADNTVIYWGGEMFVSSSGVADPTTIYRGGSEIVSAGGTDNDAQISGGTQLDYGLASGATVFAGSQVVEAGGTASGTIVSGGGWQIDFGYPSGASLWQRDGDWHNGREWWDGGPREYTTWPIWTWDSQQPRGLEWWPTNCINNGGYEFVASGGSADGTVIDRGGFVYVASGGSISGATISGGTLDLASGASVASGALTLTFSSGGELILNDAVQFGGFVAGFSGTDRIDLVDITYVASGGSGSPTTLSWTQLTSGASASGTLTMSGGGSTADITLLGQYVAGNFSIQSDGHGGTLVTDLPALETPHYFTGPALPCTAAPLSLSPITGCPSRV